MSLLILLGLMISLIALVGYILIEILTQINGGGTFTLVELLLGGILISLILLVMAKFMEAK